MSREFKVANCWKARKLRLKMYLTEQKSCSLLTQIKKNKQKKQSKNVNKCARWKVQKQGRCRTLQEKIREKKVFQQVKSQNHQNVAISQKTNFRRKKKSRKTQDFNCNFVPANFLPSGYLKPIN